MNQFNLSDLKKLYVPPPSSHKGQNGKVLIIAGSKLFHAASLWPLKIVSRIVDMTYYSSVVENNKIVQKAKQEFRDGIVVPREKVEDYINEADCVLIGPGLPRKDGQEKGDDDTKQLSEKLLKKFPNKKWIIDGGSLQTIDPKIIPQNSIATPHHGEFKKLFKIGPTSENVAKMAKKFKCVILLKGQADIVCDKNKCVVIEGGNAGMTKGGTGDVLAGLVAALYCKNDAFLSACAGSYINKKAGESLYKRVGYYFNSSDLVEEIPKVMKELIL
ncbi:MAG: NAD(P)H-hydrate dehydratase [Candidatus Levybacteria bacterium]|nr:NAD(P)H-hydrate dehydratase [Candidatus Levybacteria bacterium]